MTPITKRSVEDVEHKKTKQELQNVKFELDKFKSENHKLILRVRQHAETISDLRDTIANYLETELDRAKLIEQLRAEKAELTEKLESAHKRIVRLEVEL